MNNRASTRLARCILCLGAACVGCAASDAPNGSKQQCTTSTGVARLPTFSEWFLAGDEPGRFFADVWQRQVLLLRNISNGPRVDFRDIDRAIELARARGVLRGSMAKEGIPIASDGELTRTVTTQAFADGASLSLRTSVSMLNAQLARAARAVEMATGMNCEVNTYVSNASSASGFRPHWDEQDVFVLQLAGTKAWKVFSHGDKELPFGTHKPRNWPRKLPASLRDPVVDAVLRPGDMLYIPRGFFHYVQPSRDAPSLHASFTVPTEGFAWREALRFAVDPVGAVAPDVTQLPATTRLRRALAAPLDPGSNKPAITCGRFLGALLQAASDADMRFRRSVLPVTNTTAARFEELAGLWTESINGRAAQRLLAQVGVKCGPPRIAELQQLLRRALSIEHARLVQELELRFFQGLRHFKPPRAPQSCGKPAPGSSAVAMTTKLMRNQHTPAVIIALHDTNEVALFAEDFYMDAYPEYLAPALRSALTAQTPFTVAELQVGSNLPSQAHVLKIARALVNRQLCCRLS